MKNVKKMSVMTGFIVLGIILGMVFFQMVLRNKGKVKVYMEGESGKIGDSVVVDLKVTDIPQEYQASSFVIAFDNQKLKLMGIRQGNVGTLDKETESILYPEWQYDADSANASGEVSAMYLDMTAGEQPFSRKGFKKGKQDVLFRMEFQILTTCAAGESLNLDIAQATFASVHEEQSLSMQKKNLKTDSYEIKVTE